MLLLKRSAIPLNWGVYGGEWSWIILFFEQIAYIVLGEEALVRIIETQEMCNCAFYFCKGNCVHFDIVNFHLENLASVQLIAKKKPGLLEEKYTFQLKFCRTRFQKKYVGKWSNAQHYSIWPSTCRPLATGSKPVI